MLAGNHGTRCAGRDDLVDEEKIEDAASTLSHATSGIEPEEGASTLYLYTIVLVAAVGGFLFGYDLSLISGAIIFLKAEFTLSPFWFGAVTGSAILGCPFGPLAGVWLSDSLGRKRTRWG